MCWGSPPGQRTAPESWLHADRGHSQGGEHGLELVPQPGGDASGPGHPALRPKALPHAVIEVQQDQPPGGLDEGYETDATAFTDGGYTTEEETPHHMRNKRHFLRGRPAGKPSALRNAGVGVCPTSMPCMPSTQKLERLRWHVMPACKKAFSTSSPAMCISRAHSCCCEP